MENNKNPRYSAGKPKYENAKDYGLGSVNVMVFGFNRSDCTTWLEYSTKTPILGVLPNMYVKKGVYKGKTLKISLFVSSKVNLEGVNKNYFEWVALQGEKAFLEKRTLNGE